MTDSEADRYSGAAIEDARPPDGIDPEEWRARQRTLHRLIFRAGARAGLSTRFDGLGDDALARLEWLAERGFFADDLQALTAELRDRREKGDAITSTYGLTDSDLHSMIGEGFHTAFRKAVDSPEAVVIWKLIKDMDSETWGAIVGFVADPIIAWLREAQAKQEETGEGDRS